MGSQHKKEHNLSLFLTCMNPGKCLFKQTKWCFKGKIQLWPFLNVLFMCVLHWHFCPRHITNIMALALYPFCNVGHVNFFTVFHYLNPGRTLNFACRLWFKIFNSITEKYSYNWKEYKNAHIWSTGTYSLREELLRRTLVHLFTSISPPNYSIHRDRL